MSYSVSINNAAESGNNVDESIEKARAYAKSTTVDDAAREKRDAVIDAQLDAVRALVDAVGETRIVSFSCYGHVNADGSGSVGMSGSLGVPVPATVPHG